MTLLPFVIFRQQGITKSTDALIYSRYYRCICIIRFIRFIDNIWNELKSEDSSNLKNKNLQKIYPYFKIKNFQNALILVYSRLKNSKHFHFGFDQVERKRTEELWSIILQRAEVNLYLLLLDYLKVLLLYYGSVGSARRNVLLIQLLNCKYITD